MKFTYGKIGKFPLLLALIISFGVIGWMSFVSVSPPKASAAGAGKMIAFWDDTQIPSGWTCVSCSAGDPFYEKFIMGSTTYGLTGGATTTAHTVAWSASTNNSASLVVRTRDVPLLADVHAHNSLGSNSASSTDTRPPHRGLKVIRYNTIGEPTQLPTGIILLFDATVPSGWTAYSAQDSYFVQGSTTAGFTGGTTTHAHGYIYTTGTPSATVVVRNNAGTVAALGTHTHSGSGTATSSNNLPPYTDVIMGKLNATTTPVNNIIALWDESAPGTWSTLSGAGGVFENRFFRASSTYSGTQFGNSTHTHSNDVTTTGGPSTTQATEAGTGASLGTNTHTHSITVSFASTSNTPPYITAIFAKRQKPVLTMSNYRWFNNLDSATPGMALANEGVPAVTPIQGTKFRLRMTIHSGTYGLAVSGMDLKLQFAQQSGTCDTAYTGETYADVATGSGVIRFDDNSSVSDGATALATSTDPTHGGDTVNIQTYEEANPFTNSVSAVTTAQDALFDFLLVDTSAPGSTAYCFRVVENDGTAIGVPSTVPEITTAPPAPSLSLLYYRWRNDDGGGTTASWMTNENTPITTATSSLSVYKGDRKRLRFSVSNTGAADATNYTYRLDYASSSCTAWLPVPTTSTLTSEEWAMDLSQYVTDGLASTALLTVPGGKSFIAGEFRVYANSSSAKTLTNTQYSEFEYSIRSTATAQNGLTYCFRLTNAGVGTYFVYSTQPQITLAPPSARPTTGGAGVESFGSGTAQNGGTTTGGGGLEGGGGGSSVGGGGGRGGGGLE